MHLNNCALDHTGNRELGSSGTSSDRAQGGFGRNSKTGAEGELLEREVGGGVRGR